MRIISSATVLAVALAVGSCAQQPAAGTPTPAPVVTPSPQAGPSPGGPGGPGGPPMTPADSAAAAARAAFRRDSIAKDRDKLYNEALAKIAGRENQPAESVYKNIKLFVGTPPVECCG